MASNLWYLRAGLTLAFALASGAAWATGPQAQGQAQVDITIAPFASLTFTTPNLLALEVPPSKSTVNTSGAVRYVVTGNAVASLSAAPDQFVVVPGPSGGYFGKAIKGSDVIGYQLLLTFPTNGVSGSPPQFAGLPLSDPQGTSPLSVNMTLTGGQRPGAIDLLASADWTPDGGLPLPGLYVGQIILTLTASNL